MQLHHAAAEAALLVQPQAALQTAGEHRDTGAQQIGHQADYQLVEQTGGEAVAGQRTTAYQPDALMALFGQLRQGFARRAVAHAHAIR